MYVRVCSVCMCEHGCVSLRQCFNYNRKNSIFVRITGLPPQKHSTSNNEIEVLKTAPILITSVMKSYNLNVVLMSFITTN